MTLRVLVTNDDGVESPGLHALAAAVVEAGFDVIVVAPDDDMSGTSSSLGRLHADAHIDAVPVELPGLPGVPALALPGPPGLCVLAARLGALGDPPDLVVSGINPGCNTGRAVLHSGTVGAALTAANFGARGLAVSVDRPDIDTRAAGAPPQWATAAAVGTKALRWLAGAPDGTVLNVNAPNLPLDEVRGYRWATLAPFGTVRTTVVEPAGPTGGRMQLELRPGGNGDLPAGSDTALVKAGYVTLTRLRGIEASDPLDPGEIWGADP